MWYTWQCGGILPMKPGIFHLSAPGFSIWWTRLYTFVEFAKLAHTTPITFGFMVDISRYKHSSYGLQTKKLDMSYGGLLTWEYPPIINLMGFSLGLFWGSHIYGNSHIVVTSTQDFHLFWSLRTKSSHQEVCHDLFVCWASCDSETGCSGATPSLRQGPPMPICTRS